MAKYKMTVNTEAYVPEKCTKNNWGAGIRNDYMEAINGITRTLKTKQELLWQLELFSGIQFLDSAYRGEDGFSEQYMNFLRKNVIIYQDKICRIPRSQYLSVYGCAHGYVDYHEIVSDLKKTGDIAIIQFTEFYDVEEFDKALIGCYLMIEKIA